MKFNTTITLTILEEDVRQNNYLNSMDCPITRALARAGYPELRDVGYLAYKELGKLSQVIVTSDAYDKLVAIVVKMDNYMDMENDASLKGSDFESNREFLTPKTFDHTFEVNL